MLKVKFVYDSHNIQLLLIFKLMTCYDCSESDNVMQCPIK